jgi:hypothetical protein
VTAGVAVAGRRQEREFRYRNFGAERVGFTEAFSHKCHGLRCGRHLFEEGDIKEENDEGVT